MSSHQASHLRNVLMSRSAQFRQLEEERMVQRQQEEEERLRRQKEEEENRKRDEAEQEARRRRQEEETIRRINEFLARLAEREGERPATEEVVEEMKDSAFKLKVDSEEICAICQDGMRKGEKVIPFPCPAEHQFHEDCMFQFLAHGSSCPLCRHQVEHDTPVDEHALLGILQLLFT
ncbi:PREDICTED: PERQ amino acid-rich with GYF domain-containing protein 2-like [Branchiostoma belcheri]|uniref:PERQ amino acid-rich with GYF domain-containing protein 2-like n=1 Tax=Branchiostoma belcheri TaxID=7741 RepID=A0A6P4YG28_BRABE|nr:PREDICTED: PERQ amino acid-rich with GYF domain-containing protein 2-like [Branchiostoma belcheri]